MISILGLSKLFNDSKLTELATESRLIYIYLITRPSMNNVGVIKPIISELKGSTGLSVDQLRTHTKSLIESEYLYSYDKYLVAPICYNKRVSTVKSEFEQLPRDLRDYLVTIGINPLKHTTKAIFKVPTYREVSEYAMSMGYIFDGKPFVDYYNKNSKGKDHWYNKYGKKVINWKGTLLQVWLRGAEKVKKLDNAPEGYEYFFVEKGDGYITPDGWRDGKPCSKDFINDMMLKREYENRTNND